MIDGETKKAVRARPVDQDADYCLFTVGLGSKGFPTLAIDDADLVITMGFDMVEYHPKLWNPKSDKCVIHALPPEHEAERESALILADQKDER